MIFYSVSYNVFIYYRLQLRPVVDFMIKNLASRSCYIKSDCNEIRKIPKILQNKKIVFNSNADIKFEPLDSNIISLPELDVLGYLDADHFWKEPEETINPKLGERGYLKNREYKIIRAVYHYNCSYCFDTNDYSYIVIEDKQGNRFTSMLDDSYFKNGSYVELSWDKYMPYYLRNDNFEKDKKIVELIDIQNNQ